MNYLDFYIDGEWVKPLAGESMVVIDPTTERSIGAITLGTRSDLDRAVAAARRAFAQYAQWSREERLDLLGAIIEGYRQHSEALVELVHREMGAPLSLARNAHVPAGLGHLQRAFEVLRSYEFDRHHGIAAPLLGEGVGDQADVATVDRDPGLVQNGPFQRGRAAGREVGFDR